MNRTTITLLCVALMISGKSQAQDDFPVLSGPYLGQTPPSLTPEVFAPGIVSIAGRFEGAIAFSPDLNEMYFGADDKSEKTGIYFSRIDGGTWTPIKRANFTQGKKPEEIHPSVSPDGNKIYFTALNSDLSDTRIWYVNRGEKSWGKAVKLGSPINDGQVFYPNQAKNGDLYYYDLSQHKTYYATADANTFSNPKQVDIEFGVHGFIAPSQNYLVLNARQKNDSGRNDHDLYVAFKDKDGAWTKPVNLGGAVNSHAHDTSPSITPDGKYLFFSRNEADGKSNIYWVSTKVIENLRPKSKVSSI